MRNILIKLIEMGYKIIKDVSSEYIYAKKVVNSLTENYIKLYENIIIDYYTYSNIRNFKNDQMIFIEEAIKVLNEDIKFLKNIKEV